LLSIMVKRDEVQLGVIGNHLLMDDLPWEDQGESHNAFSRELKARGIDKLTFQRGFSRTDLEGLVEVLGGDRASGDIGPSAGAAAVAALLAGGGVSRIRVGHLELEKKEEETPETSGGRGAYQEAVTGLQETMEGVQAGRLLRIKQIHNLVDLLVENLSR